MRDDAWLSEKMYELWEDHFEDVPRLNHVLIKFGKHSKRQLGAIGWLSNPTRKTNSLLKEQGEADDRRVSLINITSYFKDETIPETVVLGTIAHELCHYAHGFNSPLKQIYDHPHKGGIIRKELLSRGLGQVYKDSRKWLKGNWREYLKQLG
jgi:hypothetical protein